jgi:carbon monoxide dehydrogenase subunit G
MKEGSMNPVLARRAFTAALLSTVLVGCGHAELAPRDPSRACQPGAPLPTLASGPGFPCWPQGLSPAESSIHVENQREIPAPPAVVWAWLTRADRWSTWFPQAKSVHFERGGPELREGTVVAWEMLGATIRVTVTRADAPGVLAWEGGAGGVHAYHAWLLVPEGSGTRVLTVETERGPVPALFGWTFEEKLHRAHEAWLEGLADVAARGALPPPAR